MIRTQLIGHLGKDAIVNNVNGKTVINFSVAHTTKYKNTQGQNVEKTIWIKCALWRDSLKVSEYLKKGTQVFVAGEPSLNTYTNNAREVIPQLNLRVEELHLLGSPNRSQSNQAPQNTGVDTAPTYGEPVDDLPF